MRSIHGGFQDSQQMSDVADLFRWLDLADGLESMQEIKRRMLEVCPPHDGERILDVGCGIGHEVRRLARRVGPRGRVLGLDKSLIAMRPKGVTPRGSQSAAAVAAGAGLCAAD